jgi:hypothetical protein
MKIATHDRAEVLNLAGTNHLSPAIRDGAPVLVEHGETTGRTGWERFFATLDRAGLELSWDTEDPSTVRAIPVAEARPLEAHPPFAEGVARARRFVAAMRSAPPAAGAPQP